MPLSESVIVMIWINVRVCLPFTVLLIALCCMVRLDYGPVAYYINLLFFNLIQLIFLVAVTVDPPYYRRIYIPVVIYAPFAVASLCFRMNIALERCFLISCQLPCCVTQTRGFVIVCVWVFSLGCGFLFVLFEYYLFFPFIAYLPGPVFIMCLLWTLKSRKANISVSAEEKQATIGILLVLLVNYAVSILPGGISLFYFRADFIRYYFDIPAIFLTLFLLSPCMDLVLFVFMVKGLIAKLLVCLCCRKEASAGLTSAV